MKFEPINRQSYDALRLDVQKRAKLGDRDAHPRHAHWLQQSHDAVSKFTGYVDTLLADKTGMSAAQGHSYALKAGKQAAKTVRATRDELHKEVVSLAEEAEAESNAFFKDKLPRQAVELRAMQLVAELASNPERVMEIHKLTDDPAIAAVIYLTPAPLLGLVKSSHEALQIKAVRKHTPDAWTKTQDANELSRLVAGHDDVLHTLETSVAIPALAQQHDSRPLPPEAA